MQFETDMASNQKDLFLAARAFLVERYSFTETKKPRITTYSDKNGGICHMRTMAHGVDFGFLKGALMKDDHAALSGNGKRMRVLSLSELDENLISYYLDQAVRLNAN